MTKRSGKGIPAVPVVLLSALVLCLTPPGGVVADDGDCMMCHENIGAAFEVTVHGRIQGFEVLDGATGCATCHGDGMEHMEEGGDPEKIRGLGAEMSADEISTACLTCHRTGSLHDWNGSTHPMSGVGCTDCHTIHAEPAKGTRDPDACMDCHSDVQAELQYPSHHPVREGHMSCGSCHEPHGSSIGLLKNEERPSELCFTCHTHLQGPFIFEHDPVSEGCDTCHAPHGAVANNLLVQTEPFLCLQCHEMHFHAGLEAHEETEYYVPRFDPAQNPSDGITYENGMVPNPFGADGYRRAFTTKCTQCHFEIHGSDLPSQALSGMGGGLTQ